MSPVGNDTNQGSEARPFRTLQAAQAAVRTAYSKGVRADLTVLIRGGTYYLSSAWAFDDRDSPPSGYSVTYRNYPNESPVIVGGRRITNWELDSGQVYKARVGTDWKFYTLFENGVRSTAARTPNEGYAKVAAAVPADKTQFVYAPGDLPSDLRSSDARVYIWAGHNWSPEVVPITANDGVNRTITVAAATQYAINQGDRYFIQGSRDLLDRPGEFSLSEADGYLYYWPRSTPIENQEIIAPTTPRIIEVKGRSSEALARNIVFQGLTLTVTDFAKRVSGFPLSGLEAVWIENAEKITVQFCKISNIGGHGIVVGGQAQGNVVYGNLMEDLGIHGVLLQGLAIGEAHVNKNNRISNNHIRRGGQLHGFGSGVFLHNSGDNEVSYNKISNMPRYGISLKGRPFGAMAPSYKGVAVTWENHWNFINTRNNLVQFNEIFRVLTDSEDAGGIEAWGAGKGNAIHSNRVHDFTAGAGRRDGTGRDDIGSTNGIYLDDASDYNRVTNNIIYGVTGGSTAAVVLKGIYNEFSNNIVVNESVEPTAPTGVYSAHVISVAFLGERNDNLRITRNIFVSDRVSEIYRFYDWSDQRIAEADRNLFYHKSGSYFVAFTYNPKNRITLDEWRTKYGFDRASAVGDPLFVDAAQRDYRLRSNSPAFALGFVEIDHTSIGLKADFPFPRD